MRRIFPALLASLLVIPVLPLCADAGESGFQEVAFGFLSDRNVSALGIQALGIRQADWKHSESEHFIYHYFQSHIAAPCSVEAEYYYGTIAKELGKETAQWERKSHIFIFDRMEDWGAFQKGGGLDPWTGGLHAGGELFIHRPGDTKWKGSTLGHEVAHLVLHRFYGNGIPRWLNEGFAEYAASRGYAAFHRARGYRARPQAQAVDPALYFPLAELTSMPGYPAQPERVTAYYDESQRLVRYLCAADKAGFGVFLEAMSMGNRFDTALTKGFGSRFASPERMESDFKDYATREHGTSVQD